MSRCFILFIFFAVDAEIHCATQICKKLFQDKDKPRWDNETESIELLLNPLMTLQTRMEIIVRMVKLLCFLKDKTKMKGKRF